ncbi:hypothetical protein WD019_13320 [Fictibacillus sp. Mic-4]|uniref:hypothetical protein n=1 Tax=Fictibacillus TaxID=1329200 RepID=UPI0004030431|nr:hypothetical protein [Fictibacillus gelatini]
MAKKAGKKKVVKKGMDPGRNKYEHTMKMVTSDTCIACRTKCARGIAYIEKMSEPGTIGYGVPCHLTKGKGMK